MPTYVYYCPECGEEEVIEHDMDREPTVVCVNPDHPDHKEKNMERKIFSSGFILKGDDWTEKFHS